MLDQTGAVPGNGLIITLPEMPPESIIFGDSLAMREVRRQLPRIAANGVPVLIYGESGTGKEIIANLIHGNSPFAASPFIKVNCPAIPGMLLESELFGYEKGAFTGAYSPKPGRVELAKGGTLFLDEISEMDVSLQSKLLQFLQDGHFSRIGGQGSRRIEVRTICATNRNLEAQVENGTFRQDLFYRINVISIRLPALRERAADIPGLSSYFLKLYNELYNCSARPLSANAVGALMDYSWPGNVRQLENVMKRYAIFGTEDAIFAEMHQPDSPTFVPVFTLDGATSLKKITRDAVRDLERHIIMQSLQASNWNRKRAARLLSISYRALLYKIKNAGISPRAI
jgi:two-component system, NtrC family, response regulator AtoC